MTDAVDYTIVICTYNPDERVLNDCLKSVYELNRNNIETEVILVDNNSANAVATLACVKYYLKLIPAMTLLREPKAGVKYARIAAIDAAKGKYIVYIDYDNQPANDYLQELKKLNASYPQVAAWGPGNVTVNFIDGIDPILEEYGRIAFQERHEQGILFGSSPDWQSYYPFGTGLCTYSSLLREYVTMEENGKFTLQGRQGDQLTSGEDTQMVLVCISKGYAAGVAPQLKLHHLINQKKSNFSYLMKLAYGTSVCYETCLLQVFPERRTALEQKRLKGAAFSRRVLKKYIQARWKKDPLLLLQLAQYIGINAGAYEALNIPVPTMVKRIIKSLQLN